MRTTEHNWILKKENQNARYTFIVVDQAASISNGKPERQRTEKYRIGETENEASAHKNYANANNIWL